MTEGAVVTDKVIPNSQYDYTPPLLAKLAADMPGVAFFSLQGSRPLTPDQQNEWRVKQIGVFHETMVKVLKGVLQPYLADPDAPAFCQTDRKYIGLVQIDNGGTIHYRLYEAHDRWRLGMAEFSTSMYTGLPTTGILFRNLPEYGENAMEIISIRSSKAVYWYDTTQPVLGFCQRLTQRNLQTLNPFVDRIKKK